MCVDMALTTNNARKDVIEINTKKPGAATVHRPRDTKPIMAKISFKGADLD